jgi:hypothetical protein
MSISESERLLKETRTWRRGMLHGLTLLVLCQLAGCCEHIYDRYVRERPTLVDFMRQPKR